MAAEGGAPSVGTNLGQEQATSSHREGGDGVPNPVMSAVAEQRLMILQSYNRFCGRAQSRVP